MWSDFSELSDKYPSASLLISGHSMGGALATFSALDILDFCKKKIELTTFG